MQLSLILLFLQLWGNMDVSLSQTACPGLPDIPHAFITEESKKDQYQPGDVIYFSCETGYISGPTIKYACTNKGWEAIRRGKCTLKPCQLPDDTPNGHYEIIKGEEFVFGTVIQYFCNQGYQMMSKVATRTCMLDRWSNHVPVCEPLSCDPPLVGDGLKVKGLPENDEPILPGRFLTFSCDIDGKHLNGSSVLVCGEDGQWDNPFPACEDITCKVDVMNPHLQATGLPTANKTVKIGHVLQFNCDDGYTVDGSKEIECLPSGQWNSPFPTCSENCLVTRVQENVRIIPQHVPGAQLSKGQKIRFGCRHGSIHVIHGNAEVECLADGQWSGPFPTCGPPLGCGKPPTLADGDIKDTVKSKYLQNERVEYICQRFYTMESEPYKTCRNGQWTGSLKCLRPCTVDRELMNTHKITFKYRRDDKLYTPHKNHFTFTCIRGATHDGTLEMRQQCLDGVINLPTCQ